LSASEDSGTLGARCEAEFLRPSISDWPSRRFSRKFAHASASAWLKIQMSVQHRWKTSIAIYPGSFDPVTNGTSTGSARRKDV